MTFCGYDGSVIKRRDQNGFSITRRYFQETSVRISSACARVNDRKDLTAAARETHVIIIVYIIVINTRARVDDREQMKIRRFASLVKKKKNARRILLFMFIL